MIRMSRRRCVAVVAFVLCGSAGVQSQETAKRAITFDDMIKLHRVGSPQISPDGKWVAYAAATPDMDANRNASNIWVVPIDGGTPIQLTQSGHDTSPAWSPDGKMLAFISSRSGESQIYVLPLDGGEAHAWTHLSTGADTVKWSPDGKTIAFTSLVYPDCKDDACNKSREEAKAKNKVKAHVAENLLYRHWNHWTEGKRSHLFVVAAPANAAQTEAGSAPRDLTTGANYDVPPDVRGDENDLNFSPDGTELCFTAVTEKMEAISTNADLFLVPVAGGAEPKRITKNPGYDGNPVYSPDGKYIAYHAQLINGFEADRWRVWLYDRQDGKNENLTETSFDRNATELTWSADSKAIYFLAENETLQPVYSVEPHVGAVPKKIVADGFNLGLSISKDGKTIVFERTGLTLPGEIFAALPGEAAKQLTHHNDSILAGIELPTPETFWFDAADGTRVQAMLLRPPNFDSAKKYPLLLILHGGPQTQFSNAWSYRWNPQVFSAAGYVSLMINRRGSTGYSQKFTDEITNDWGGKAYTDVMKGVDVSLAKYKFIDGTRMAAAGGSYGGYMANWIATHTGRFKAIISHAGIWDKPAMYGTEELWFEEHDMMGTPWGASENYKKWSPMTYAGELGKYKTPTLVVAGELDFRVPYTQATEFFSALQRQSVPSKLVIFPDEGHWVLKPQNSQFWYKTFLDWLWTYLK
jgi:dipeptidyl aminopeptidase/acylaminoacyl peptidase